MKYLFAIFLIAALFSCQSRKAREFNTLLDSTEKKVFRVLVANSMERNRLEALIDRKPDLALSIGRRQAIELINLIKKIDQTDVNEIPDANPLKTSTANYYRALLRLKEADILEARLMAITLQRDTARARKAEIDISNLTRKRLELHRVISESDQAKLNAKTKFEETNSIR